MWRLFYAFIAIVALYPIASKALWSSAGSIKPAAHDINSPEKISSSWGKKLDPSGAIPDIGFKAIYFNRRNPGSVVYSENVDSIAIKYAWADFHNINSPDLGAYWVGRIKVPDWSTREISVSQSWAKSRILIDGEIVFDGGDSRTFEHSFGPGEHIVEVEYINNWHTTEFKVTIGQPVRKMSEGDLSSFFSQRRKPASLYYVGLYESGSKDTSVDVSLPPSGKPVVLWLTSYEAIDWNISAPDRVEAVVVSSYAPGSRVTGVGAADVLTAPRGSYVYSVSQSCSCAAGNFHCEEDHDLLDVAEKVESITGLKLGGYAATYSAPAVSVSPYNESVAREFERRRDETAEARKQCTQKADPDFDHMMGR